MPLRRVHRPSSSLIAPVVSTACASSPRATAPPIAVAASTAFQSFAVLCSARRGQSTTSPLDDPPPFSSFSASSSSSTYGQSVPRPGEAGYSASLPTAEKYRQRTVEELITLLQTRERQIRDLRSVYENFHNEVEKLYRKQIFDYHDKAVQFSHVHGQMQSNSINHTREALIRMREQEELEHRDLKIVYTTCLIATLVFWVWVRRHYINREDAESARTATDAGDPAFSSRVINPPLFFPSLSKKLAGANIPTAFELEMRERQQKAKGEEAPQPLKGGSAAQSTSHTRSSDSSGSQPAEDPERIKAVVKELRGWRSSTSINKQE